MLIRSPSTDGRFELKAEFKGASAVLCNQDTAAFYLQHSSFPPGLFGGLEKISVTFKGEESVNVFVMVLFSMFLKPAVKREIRRMIKLIPLGRHGRADTYEWDH